MKRDQGLIYVLLGHFTRHLHPRALEIEKSLDAGERLSDVQLAHIAEVLEQLKSLRPLFERHPEDAELVAGVVSMYAGIVRRARQNEPSGVGARESA